jgi:hypothetical protein
MQKVRLLSLARHRIDRRTRANESNCSLCRKNDPLCEIGQLIAISSTSSKKKALTPSP